MMPGRGHIARAIHNATPVDVARRADTTQYVKQTATFPIAIGATIAVIIVLVGIIVAIFVAWRINIKRRKKKQANDVRPTTLFGSNDDQHADIESSFIVEKPREAVLRPVMPTADSGVRWAPQIRTVGGLAVLDKKPSVQSLTSTYFRDIKQPLPEIKQPLLRSKASPPPSYAVANSPVSKKTDAVDLAAQTAEAPASPASPPVPSPKNLPPTPSSMSEFSTHTVEPQVQLIVTAASSPAGSPKNFAAPSPPPTSSGSKSTAASNLRITLPPTPAAPCLTTVFPITPGPPEADQPSPKGTIQIVMPSPRSSSFRAAKSIWSTTTTASVIDPNSLDSPDGAKPPPLPSRLMVVIDTFVPSLDDELAVRVGEVVHMLEEYRDGWCLVQRVGRLDAQRGVVPRTHIEDRKQPAHHKQPSLLQVTSGML
ncbi:hypothetical protein HGRIS_012707 [Hohenbuehelia grisea]|uniref:SH3 domain-containing protein n=1 Tax=Hohenbuehelia grisea TaxID=104357 RepID=A0ABR3IT42_9AGAR